jgi:hypothetical protein
MPSNNPNIFKRAYENVMGTPEQNKKAKEDIEKYKASKAKEKAAEEEKKMAKGGAVKGKGKVTKSGSKAAKAGKAPILAIMVGVAKPKTKMAAGGMSKKKKC